MVKGDCVLCASVPLPVVVVGVLVEVVVGVLVEVVVGVLVEGVLGVLVEVVLGVLVEVEEHRAGPQSRLSPSPTS